MSINDAGMDDMLDDLERGQQLTKAVREFFELLDIEEESNNGRLFHPNRVSSCRVLDGQRLGEVMQRMRELSDVR